MTARVNNYLNLAAFTSPAAGTYSTLRPNAFVGPSRLQNDLAVSRTFRWRRASLQFRWEVFNVLNNGELQQPDLGVEQHRTSAASSRPATRESCSSPSSSTSDLPGS